MPNKVAINGLGRIGRAALKLAVEAPQLELVAVNEIGSLDNMVYLLRYDSVYGRYERQVDAVGRAIDRLAATDGANPPSNWATPGGRIRCRSACPRGDAPPSRAGALQGAVGCGTARRRGSCHRRMVARAPGEPRVRAQP